MYSSVLISGHNMSLHLQEASWVASILSIGCFLGKDSLIYIYPGCDIPCYTFSSSGYQLASLLWDTLFYAYLVWISGCILAVGYLAIHLLRLDIRLYPGCGIPCYTFTSSGYQLASLLWDTFID